MLFETVSYKKIFFLKLVLTIFLNAVNESKIRKPAGEGKLREGKSY
jgi:hypothetical protein